MKNFPLRPFDFLIFAAVISAGIFFTFRAVSNSGQTAIVDANGSRYEYSLSQNGVFTVQGALGPTIFEIKDGRVHILDSACPGKNCVHQGFSSPLVCLPNKVIITVESDGGFDALSE